jgi:hypothetical protein
MNMTEMKNECKELSDSNGSAVLEALATLDAAIGNMQCVLFDEDERNVRGLSNILCDLDDAITAYRDKNRDNVSHS